MDKNEKIYNKLFEGNNNKSIDTLQNTPHGMTLRNKME